MKYSCSLNISASGINDLVIANPISTESGTNDVVDIAVKKALPKLFSKDSNDNQTKGFVEALENTLSTANMTQITERDNTNSTRLCSVGVFLCFRGACHCSGDSNVKRNLILDNKTPFSKECLRGVSRVCYHGRCYCRLHQNVNMERSSRRPFVVSEGSVDEFTQKSSGLKTGYDNLRPYFLLIILVLFILNKNDYLY